MKLVQGLEVHFSLKHTQLLSHLWLYVWGKVDALYSPEGAKLEALSPGVPSVDFFLLGLWYSEISRQLVSKSKPSKTKLLLVI